VEYLHRATYVVLDDLANQSIALLGVGGRRRRFHPGDGNDEDVLAFRSHDPELEFLPMDDVLPIDRTIGRLSIDLAMGGDAVAGGERGGEDPGGGRDVTLLSLGGMMSSPDNVEGGAGGEGPNCSVAANAGGRRSFPFDGASPSVMTRALLANLLGGYGADGDGGGGEGGGGGGGRAGNNCRGGTLRLLGGTDIGPNGALLMPGTPSNDKPRPIRIGITIRLPPGMDNDDRPSAAVTGSRTRADDERRASSKRRGGDDDDDVRRQSSEGSRRDPRRRPYLADLTFDEVMMNGGGGEDGGRRPALLIKPGALLFGDEFAHIAKAHARNRYAARRRRRLLEREGEEGATMIDAKDVLDVDDDENDSTGGGGGGFDYGGYDDDFSVGPTDVDDTNRSIHRSNVDFDVIGDVFTNAASSCDRFDDDDCDRRADYDYDGYTNNDGRKTFEELCRAHLRKFAKSAEIYAAETQLTKRVGRWQMGLAPLLEVQEERPEFNIHQVGRQILERIERGISVRKRTSTGEKRLDSTSASGGSRNNIVRFSTIVRNDCEEYEVCRVFLSTLMLCNCGNIALQNGGDGDDVELVDSFKIELLNSTFRPPMESLFTPLDDTHPQENIKSSTLGMIDENGIVVEE
ncbi:hypothetical protein ACHAXA_008916, partial [Cyclostephanos tholiformis]